MASGGAKLGYHASQHIRLKAKFGVTLKQGDRIVGKVITAEMKKDKVGGKERAEADGSLIFGEGFSKTADLFQDALDKKVITKNGNSYFLGEEKLGMISKVREMMKDESFADKLKSLL